MPITVSELKEDGARTIDLPDRLERRVDPWRVMWGTRALNAFADWGMKARLVPSEYWSLDNVTAVIACPCGETPEAVALETIVECACERSFFFDSRDVWAFNTPSSEPAPVAEPDDSSAYITEREDLPQESP